MTRGMVSDNHSSGAPCHQGRRNHYFRIVSSNPIRKRKYDSPHSCNLTIARLHGAFRLGR